MSDARSFDLASLIFLLFIGQSIISSNSIFILCLNRVSTPFLAVTTYIMIAEETIVVNEKEQSEASAVTENKDSPTTTDKADPYEQKSKSAKMELLCNLYV